MVEKYVVLLSAGLDSSYNLFRAQREGQVLLALSFAYGQRAEARELEQAAKLAAQAKVPHKILKLDWFRDFGQSSLLDTSKKVPTGNQVSLSDMEVARKTAKSVWVPNRNGIFLNIAAGFAESLGANYVVPGFNLEEAATFPDNSGEFMQVLDRSFALSTANHVRVKCFTIKMNKTEIVGEALKLDLPLKDLWPCYFAGPKWCGECESCQRFQRALKENGVNL